MKKTIWTSALLALTLLATGYTHAQTSSKRKNNALATATTVALKKEKKAETWHKYAVFDGQLAEEYVQIAAIDYNDKGKKDRWKVYNESGTLKYTYLYDHDVSKNQIRCFIETEDKQTQLEYVETYNRLQQLVEREDFIDGNKQPISRKTWEYNALGKVINHQSHQIRGQKMQLAYEISYEYQEESNTCIETHTNHLSNTGHQVVIAYNDDGLPAEETSYQLTGEMLRKTTFYYDALGRISEQRIYPNGHEMEVREVFSYGALGDEQARATYTRGGEQLQEYIVYKYEFN